MFNYYLCSRDLLTQTHTTLLRVFVVGLIFLSANHAFAQNPTPDGKWHFVCKNKKAHKDDGEVTFPPSMFLEKLQMIMQNKGGSATKIANKLGIDITAH